MRVSMRPRRDCDRMDRLVLFRLLRCRKFSSYSRKISSHPNLCFVNKGERRTIHVRHIFYVASLSRIERCLALRLRLVSPFLYMDSILRVAILRVAILREAILREAILREAILREAILRITSWLTIRRGGV